MNIEQNVFIEKMPLHSTARPLIAFLSWYHRLNTFYSLRKGLSNNITITGIELAHFYDILMEFYGLVLSLL